MAEKTRNYKSQPLFDSRVIKTSTQFDYYKTPIGGTEDSITKTVFHTNLTVAGQIPNRQAFIVRQIAVNIWQDGALPIIADALKLLNPAVYFQFRIRREIYFEYPLFMLNAGSGIQVHSTTDTDKTYYTLGEPSYRALYSLGKQTVAIPALTPFDVTIQYPSAPAPATDTRLFVMLMGTIIEPVYK